ncbi:thiamine biosynthesis protein ThiI [Amycolatopsis echigonensis]|uniref:Probable tRNA sulfurtransferase n=1 Tax=Amycolatopsis echigonensis TaxID=2576905 RepID=A0A2N3X236_9PSEU|nr:tRNA uracil 4-sulfurtransferase ThiI [Amycolatopsis niigatensis]PKW00181.1 thiamine biosynthesis protein ThiI [Amycolatopsis niigatensis]
MRESGCVLLKYGELALKGRNRRHFEDRLAENVRRALADVAGVRLRRRAGLLVLSARAELDEVVRRARDVPGVSVVQPAVRAGKTADEAAAAAVDLLRAESERTFRVRVRRRDKRFPMTSEELAKQVGARVVAELGLPVDLEHPDVTVTVEVDEFEIFVSTQRLPGQGGLPVGTGGRAVVLLSGGFDSPVAAYRTLRRGVHCEFVHFTGAPFTGPSSAYKAYAHVRGLRRFHGDARLHLVPLGKAQRALASAGAGELQIVAQRRLMIRCAEALARRLHADALVTGDSLGQVASQTLPNLATIDDAATLPVLRPLLGWDKTEIIAEARRIGTADVSALPDEDCCSLLTPPFVATRTTPGQLTDLEGRLDLSSTVDGLLDHAQILRPGADEHQAALGAVES